MGGAAAEPTFFVATALVKGVQSRHPAAAIILPSRSTTVPSKIAENAPTQRDLHLQSIVEHGQAA